MPLSAFDVLTSCLCLRVGQQDVDIKLSGHFIKEIHCVFVNETNEHGEGETLLKLILPETSFQKIQCSTETHQQLHVKISPPTRPSSSCHLPLPALGWQVQHIETSHVVPLCFSSVPGCSWISCPTSDSLLDLVV